MPKYRDPYEKGRLFIKFKVVFPPAGFGTPEVLAALEKLLPPRPQPMEEADVEEHTLDDFDPEAYSRESQVCEFLCTVTRFCHVRLCVLFSHNGSNDSVDKRTMKMPVATDTMDMVLACSALTSNRHVEPVG